MIVRKLSEAERSERHIVSPKGEWESTRMILRDDNMGFSFHITTIHAGADFEMHYRNHLESVYCMSGEGEVETLADGKVYPISPGTLYVLNDHDHHRLKATTTMVMACVFNPPVTGAEVHDETGAYPASTAND
jgi:L-ectoine synthase